MQSPHVDRFGVGAWVFNVRRSIGTPNIEPSTPNAQRDTCSPRTWTDSALELGCSMFGVRSEHPTLNLQPPTPKQMHAVPARGPIRRWSLGVQCSAFDRNTQH